MSISGDVRNVTKRHNTPTARAAKAEVRQLVLAAIPEAHVFDAFAGAGEMYAEVWCRAASYTGCDTQFYPDERLAYVADNRRVLRNLDLSGFNLFDLDSFGSPWEQAYIIASRRRLRPGESVGLVLTDGSGLKMKMGGVSLAMSILANVNLRVPGLGRAQSEMIDRAINRVAMMLGGTVASRWEATGKTGSSMRYIGLVISAMGRQ